MAKISSQIQIDVPKHKVWEIISDWATVSRWEPNVTSSAIIGSSKQGIGADRTCKLRQLGNITEKVFDWDEGNSITYKVSGIPNVYSMLSKLLLSGEADKTVVTVDVNVGFSVSEEESKGHEGHLHELLDMTLQGLKQYSETGQKMTPPPGP